MNAFVCFLAAEFLHCHSIETPVPRSHTMVSFVCHLGILLLVPMLLLPMLVLLPMLART
jgi:hypothetical protein